MRAEQRRIGEHGLVEAVEHVLQLVLLQPSAYDFHRRVRIQRAQLLDEALHFGVVGPGGARGDGLGCCARAGGVLAEAHMTGAAVAGFVLYVLHRATRLTRTFLTIP